MAFWWGSLAALKSTLPKTPKMQPARYPKAWLSQLPDRASHLAPWLKMIWGSLNKKKRPVFQKKEWLRYMFEWKMNITHNFTMTWRIIKFQVVKRTYGCDQVFRDSMDSAAHSLGVSTPPSESSPRPDLSMLSYAKAQPWLGIIWLMWCDIQEGNISYYYMLLYIVDRS